MKLESKVQLALAAVGLPLVLWVWKGDAKWPNPLWQQERKS